MINNMKNLKTKLLKIKAEASELAYKSDEELNEKIAKVKKKFEKEQNLAAITEEWYSLVQELSFRHLKLRHFDMQLLAGLILLEGNIIEMKTGEGKTLTSTLPVSIKALEKKGTHVITVNEYLAERDQKIMGGLYERLGLTSALVKNSNTLFEKKKSYASDITYVTNSEVVFDYLKDCTASNLDEIVQRPLHYCIIDEIDSILIDEARTPLILSGLSSLSTKKNINKLFKAKEVIKILEKNLDFIVDEKRRDVFLTEEGYQKLKNFFFFNQDSFETTNLYDLKNPWINYILNALSAQQLYLLNRDYIVLKDKVTIVDQFTGRVMEDRRWSAGLHEAIEAKENVPIQDKTETKLSITYQNFFPLYSSFSGMSGTVISVAKELKNIYKAGVSEIPTVQPMIRKDLPDKVYKTQMGKWNAIVKESIETYKKGQPLLIGTTSIEKSEFLSQLFRTSGIPHQVLNAKPENLKRENEIIARAGELGAVTIATNMAGRGTDIILGGNINFRIKEYLLKILSSDVFLDEKEKEFYFNLKKEYATNMEELTLEIENLPYSLENAQNSLKEWYQFLFSTEKKKWENENSQVKQLGGLKILGTERHESRRIDDQLRGRAGRQGDPGISQFFIALDDELLLLFGGKNIQSFFTFLGDNGEDEPLEAEFLTKSIQKAQEKIEDLQFETRKNVLEYDMVLNSQFQIFFNCRKELLFKKNISTLLLRYKEKFVDTTFFSNSFLKKIFRFFTFTRIFKKFFKTNIKARFLFTQKRENLELIQFSRDVLTRRFLGPYWKKFLKKKASSFQYIWNAHDLDFHSLDFEEKSLSDNLQFPLSVYLEILDNLWTKHIEKLSYIRETINWKAYGQQNPKNEYTISSYFLFIELLNQVQFSFLLENNQENASNNSQENL
jgi:preprotein translocase subunit SecA